MSNEFKVLFHVDGSDITSVSIGNIQHQGKRDYQEDSFGYTSLEQNDVTEKGFIAVVSDGMGGMSNGDKISRYTVSAIKEMRDQVNDMTPVHIRFTQMLNVINDAVVNGGTVGGATVSAVFCTRNGVFWCSVGDSRVYLRRGKSLVRLSRDFDYMDILLDKVIDGEMSMEDALDEPQKDNLASYVGLNERLSPDVNIRPFIPQRGDKLLICSDGVYNAVPNDELCQILSLRAQDSADEIRQSILRKNYENQDNFTAVVLEFS